MCSISIPLILVMVFRVLEVTLIESVERRFFLPNSTSPSSSSGWSAERSDHFTSTAQAGLNSSEGSSATRSISSVWRPFFHRA